MNDGRSEFSFANRPKILREGAGLSVLAVLPVFILVTQGFDWMGVGAFTFFAVFAFMSFRRVLRGPVVLDDEGVFLPFAPLRSAPWPWSAIAGSELFETGAMSLFTGTSKPTEWLRVHLVDGKRMAVPLYLIYDREGFLEAFADHVERFGSGAAGSGGEGGAD
jgi:hypothetical protein